MDPRVVVGPDLLDRLARIEAALRDIQVSLIGSSILGTDQTVKASHDRLDALFGEGRSGDHGAILGLEDNDHPQYLLAADYQPAPPPEIWLPAKTSERTQGSGSSGYSGPGSSKSLYMTMPDGSDTAYAWAVWVPVALGGAEVSVWYVAEISSAVGNVYLQVCHSYASNGASSGETTFGEKVAAWSNYRIAKMGSTLTLSAAGTLFRLALRRLSSHGDDNCTGEVRLHGVALVAA